MLSFITVIPILECEREFIHNTLKKESPYENYDGYSYILDEREKRGA